MVRQLLQDHYDLRAVRGGAARPGAACSRGGRSTGSPRTRLETGHGRLLATLSGAVTSSRIALAEAGKIIDAAG